MQMDCSYFYYLSAACVSSMPMYNREIEEKTVLKTILYPQTQISFNRFWCLQKFKAKKNGKRQQNLIILKSL